VSEPVKSYKPNIQGMPGQSGVYNYEDQNPFGGSG